jgi:hypothetical protein
VTYVSEVPLFDDRAARLQMGHDVTAVVKQCSRHSKLALLDRRLITMLLARLIRRRSSSGTSKKMICERISTCSG